MEKVERTSELVAAWGLIEKYELLPRIELQLSIP
jgi:hypothetical protein